MFFQLWLTLWIVDFWLTPWNCWNGFGSFAPEVEWCTVEDITCHMVWRPSLEGVWPCLRPGCFRDHKCCHVAQDFVAQDSRVTCHLSCVTMAFLATTGHLFIWFHASRVEHIVLLEDGSTGERRVAFRRTTRPRASHWFVFMCAWLLAKIFVVVLTYI